MDSNFKKLLENIALTDRQAEDARIKYNGVCEVLHDHFYPNIKYDGSTKLLIGSYGKLTNIRPPRDVDVLFRMPEDQFEAYNNLSGNKQSQLLQEIRLQLKGAYTTTEEIRAFGKVVVVGFSDGTHSVELLPAWALSDGKFRIPNTENGGSWEVFDPVSEMQKIRESNKKTGKTLNLIRISKKWADYCSVELKSFLIETVVLNYLESLDQSKIEESYSRLMDGFFKYLLSQANTMLISGAGELFNVGEAWKSKAETASQRASKAVQYEVNSELENASDEWKKVFGDDFPKSYDVEENINDKVIELRKRYPAQTEEFLERKYGVPFELDDSYRVKIDTQIIQAGFQPGWLSDFLRKRYMLKKSKKLTFAIRERRLPNNYSIKWKVRNFGEEARIAGDLRGEISDDRGLEEKEERTKYHGEHYVECYIISDGKCVAMDRILVPIGNTY